MNAQAIRAMRHPLFWDVVAALIGPDIHAKRPYIKAAQWEGIAVPVENVVMHVAEAEQQAHTVGVSRSCFQN